MKKKIIKPQWLAAVLVVGLHSNHAFCAQDLRSDLQSIQAVYANTARQISFDFTLRYFDRVDPSHSLESISGKYKMSGRTRFSSIGKTQTLEDSQYSLSISNEDSVIIISHAKGSKVGSPMFELNDSLLAACSSQSKFISQGKSEFKLIRLYMEKSPTIDSVDMRYDPSTWLVSNITIYYGSQYSVNPEDHPAPIVTIDYLNYHVQNRSESAFIDLTNYINIQGKKASLTPKYKNYQLINNLNIQ